MRHGAKSPSDSQTRRIFHGVDILWSSPKEAPWFAQSTGRNIPWLSKNNHISMHARNLTLSFLYYRVQTIVIQYNMVTETFLNLHSLIKNYIRSFDWSMQLLRIIDWGGSGGGGAGPLKFDRLWFFFLLVLYQNA